jgi:LysM repeat protein
MSSNTQNAATDTPLQAELGNSESRLTPAAGTPMAVFVGGPAGPGGGTLLGRLVDGVTGLPVRDAGVSLLGQDRRSISGPDGRFRLDGVSVGAITVVLGPAEDHITRSIDTRLPADGLDLGITPLLPTAPPTLILPEYGGLVTGCKDTEIRFATDALDEPTPIRVTCLHSAREFPAPAPAGRLPLAAVDLSPSHLQPSGAARLQVALPPQPRYAPGVQLDLLRLDINRLIWIPDSTIDVDEGSRTASGDVSAFGTYMVAAPPFGAFVRGAGDEPAINQFLLSAEPDGPPADVFPTGTKVVYASFDYAFMDGTMIEARTVDRDGELAFELARPYEDTGRDNVPMVHESGGWPAGAYVTTLYIGAPAKAVYSINWRVAVAPTGEPPTPTLPAVATLPSVPGSSSGSAQRPLPPARRPSAGCPIPYGWYAYTVQLGDTLFGLAIRTGASPQVLYRANCMTSTTLFAGATIYLPSPPSRQDPPAAPPAAPAQPTYPVWPPEWPGYPTPTLVPPSAMPTTWYTPPSPVTAPPDPPPATPASTRSAPSAPTTAVPAPTTEPPGPTNPPALPTEAPPEPSSPPALPTQAPPEPTSVPAAPTSAPPGPTSAPAEPSAAPPEPTPST